jgi:hypothetical protein
MEGFLKVSVHALANICSLARMPNLKTLHVTYHTEWELNDG